jgi:hypothetical protein
MREDDFDQLQHNTSNFDEIIRDVMKKYDLDDADIEPSPQASRKPTNAR